MYLDIDTDTFLPYNLIFLLSEYKYRYKKEVFENLGT